MTRNSLPVIFKIVDSRFLAHKVENPSGFTPFQTAAHYGSTEIVENSLC